MFDTATMLIFVAGLWGFGPQTPGLKVSPIPATVVGAKNSSALPG